MSNNQLDLSKLTKEQVSECLKYITRFKKHGDSSIVKKRGRKPVSPEHKKEIWKKWYENKKEEIKKSGIILKPVGRPRKIVN